MSSAHTTCGICFRSARLVHEGRLPPRTHFRTLLHFQWIQCSVWQKPFVLGPRQLPPIGSMTHKLGRGGSSSKCRRHRRCRSQRRLHLGLATPLHLRSPMKWCPTCMMGMTVRARCVRRSSSMDKKFVVSRADTCTMPRAGRIMSPTQQMRNICRARIAGARDG